MMEERLAWSPSVCGVMADWQINVVQGVLRRVDLEWNLGVRVEASET